MPSRPVARPIVGVTACRKRIEPHWYHAVQEKYLAAVSTAAGATPLVVPALGRGLDLEDVLATLDGLLLTGSPSNVEPHHYGGTLARPDIALDPHRDETTLALVRRAVESGVPLLALCRGCQEVNVVFGGTLHQLVQEVAGLDDHREDAAATLDDQYAPAHEVALAGGGQLRQLVGGAGTWRVNSLHGQGIDRLGDGLVVEATAPDGLVEAFRIEGAPAFALAVQWHPEWRVLDDGLSRAMFEAFGNACRDHAREKRRDVDPAVV